MVENFQIPYKFFRIYVKNGERPGFSYEMLMMRFFQPTAYFANYLKLGGPDSVGHRRHNLHIPELQTLHKSWYLPKE